LDYETILLEPVESGIMRLTLNRPHVLNAISRRALEELEHAVETVASEEQTKVLIITGAGERAFCTGADLKDLRNIGGDPVAFANFIKRFNRFLNRLQEIDQVVIAMIRGYCLAGGNELAMACDITVASDDAQVGDFHAHHNLLPGGGATQRLPRLVGLQKGKELLFTGRYIPAHEARDIGLLCTVVPAEQLEAYTVELARNIAEKPLRLLGTLKRLVNRGIEGPLALGLEAEAEAIVASLQFPDRAQGLEKFAKRG
jgi:enoyl-CoA hydratase